MEVDEKSEPEAFQAEIGQELGLVDRGEPLDRLDFDGHESTDDDIKPIAAIEPDPLVFQRQGLLPLEGELSPREFVTEAFFMGRLEQTWPQAPMDFDGRAHDLVG